MNTGPEQFPDDRDALGHLLGDLDEAQTAEYFAALRTWHDESEENLEAISEDPRHVPAAILSRWNRLRPSVSPLERELIEMHLRECGDCQEDLAFANSAAAPARPRARIVPWIGGGLIGAAIAASLLLALLPPDTGSPQGPQLESMQWVAPSFTRGIGSEVALPAAGQPLVLVVAIGTPQTGLIRVEILDADEQMLFEREVPADEIHGGSLLLQWQADPARPWQAGRYRCRVHDGDRVRDGEFVLAP